MKGRAEPSRLKLKALPRRYRRVSPQAQRLADHSLKQIALDCYGRAQAIREPALVREDAEEALRGALLVFVPAFVGDLQRGLKSKHRGAYKLLKARQTALVDALVAALARDSRMHRDQNIREWTVRLLMDRLLEWSLFDPEKVCDANCQALECKRCQRAIVFPYQWKKNAAAAAAKTALERAKIQPYGARRWTVDAILKIHQRHPARQQTTTRKPA